MKNITKLLTVFALVCVMMVAVFAACDTPAPHEHAYEKKWTSDAEFHWRAASCEHTDQVSSKGAHEDVNSDGACDICDYAMCAHTYSQEWSSNASQHWHAATCGHDVKSDVADHADGNEDGLCDVCSYECGNHVHTYETEWSKDADSHWHAATCGHDNMKQALAGHLDTNGDFICEVCGYEHEHEVEEDWLTDIDGHWHKAICHPNVKADYGVHVDENGDNKCDVCPSPIYEKVFYTFTVEDKEPQKAASDLIYGIFTVGKGAEIRNRTKEFNDLETGESFSFTKSVKVNGSEAAFYVNAAGVGKLTLIVQNGSSGAMTQILKMYAPGATEPEEISYPGNSEGSPLVKLEVEITEPGVYKFQCSGTTDIYHAVCTLVVEKSNLASINVSNTGTVDYLVGSDLDTSALMVEKVYENLRTEVLESGAYAVDASAFNKDIAGTYPINVTYVVDGETYTTSYDVNVYGAEDIVLGTNAIREVSQSAKDDAAASPFNGVYANTAFRQLYFVGEKFSAAGLSVTVKGVCGDATKDFIFEEGFEILGYNMAETGVQQLTVSMYGKSKQININVIAKPVVEGDVILCYVDADCTVVGALNDEMYNFATIQQALDFLGALDLPWHVTKGIVLAPGIYREKLEITIPNLTIISAETMSNPEADPSNTVIEWDSLYGTIDESGYNHTTDSTATLAVRHSAEGFVIEGVTISNYWNSIDRFNNDLGVDYPEHRALAMLVQADKVLIQNCRLLGYQDTIEFFTGRVLVDRTYIAGTTDFIFGSDATVFFTDCQIHSIKARDDKGGYITAFKGNNKNSKVEYGAIFYECTFTCDEGVASYSETDPDAKGLTAIGRPWGQDAAVAVINCELGGHISKEASTGASRGERYVTMSGNLPENARYVEYGNTGLGAITESQTGVTMLTADEVANYLDISKIFGTTNGQVKYDSQWAGISFVANVIIKDAEGNVVGTYYGYSGTTPSIEDLLATVVAPEEMIAQGLYTDAECKVAYQPSALGESHTLYTKFVPADPTIRTSTTIDLTGLPSAIEGTTGAFGVITIDATNGKFAPNGDWVQFNAGTILTFPVVDGVNIEFVEYQNAGLISCSVVDGIATLTATGNTYIKSITVVVPYTEDTTIDLTKLPEKFEGNTGYFDGILVDATNGKFALNGGGDWVQMNTGTVLTLLVAEDSIVTFEEYNNAGSITCVVEGKVATLTATGNTYIKSITIDAPEAPKTSVTYTLDISLITATLTGDTPLGDFFTGTNKVKTESIQIDGASYEADGLVFAGKQVSLTAGKAAISSGVWQNAIGFTVEEGKKATVVIYAAEKSGKSATLVVLDSTGAAVTVSDLAINGVAASAFDTLPTESVNKYEFTLSAGTYYIGGSAGGAYVYGMSVEVDVIPVVAVTHTLDISLITATLTGDTPLGDFFTGTNKVKTESIQIDGASYEADGLVFAGKQVSLTAGKVDCVDGIWQNSIGFTVEEGKTATVVIYAAEKSGKSATLVVLDSTGAAVTVSDLAINGVAASAFDTLPTESVNKYEFTLSAGTYYIGGSAGGAYVYGMSVTIK